MPGRQEAKLRIVRDLAVDQRHELVRARGLIEPGVEVLEQSPGDLAVAVQLVDRAEQKRLVEHRRQQCVRHAMTRDVDQRDTTFVLAALQVFNNIETAFGTRPIDTRCQIEALLEVDVRDVVAANRAAHLERSAPDVKALERRHLTGQRHQLLCDVLKVLQLTREPLQFFGGFRIVHEHVVWTINDSRS